MVCLCVYCKVIFVWGVAHLSFMFSFRVVLAEKLEKGNDESKWDVFIEGIRHKPNNPNIPNNHVTPDYRIFSMNFL